jgi:hypothetical protein
MLETLYGVAIGVIVVGVFAAALAPSIHTGVLGTSLLAGVLVCQIAAIERYSEAPNWRVLLTICEAGLVIYYGARWLAGRDRQ